METMLEVLAERARGEPRQTAFTFGGEACSFAELWDGIERFAAHLLRTGVQRPLGGTLQPGERVLLVLANGREFFTAFYGIQRAGAVAVPVFPGSGAGRIADIAAACGSRTVVMPSAAPELASGLRVLAVGDSASQEPADDFPAVRPADVAYIQFTSGSTGDPKGVVLSHGNLVTNVRQMIAGMQLTADEVFVSWLPACHDMGLILMTMAPFFLGARLVLLPTDLAKVHRWLRAIEENRATFTAAPDFAWRLVLRHVRDPGAYDLSSLRVALNAAEPVRARTLRDFASAFSLRRVMRPAYGLAEATVGVSMWPPGSDVAVDGRGFVSVGPPFPGIELAILRDGELRGAGEVGEILFKSPAASRGYFDNPAATARLIRTDGFLYTGDLGYLDPEGNLYVVGRVKNVIIQAGRNVAPQEVEEAVDALPFIRFSAAVGIDRGGPEGEQIYVFAELRKAARRPADEYRERVVAIVNAVHGRLGLRPGRVYLLAPHTLPRTRTGKIRHPRLKELHAGGELRAGGRVLYPDY